MFQNENLELVDQGLDTERYKFQISRSKSVNMTGTIGNHKGSFECDYGATNMQGYLYTKMQQTYPDDTISFKGTGNPNWPFGKYCQSLNIRSHANVASGACRTSGSWRQWCSILQKLIRRRREPQGSGCKHLVFMSLQELDTPTQVERKTWKIPCTYYPSFPCVTSSSNHIYSLARRSIALGDLLGSKLNDSH